eukprot:TRINITY_DN25211_c0_g1_i1.p1 TRINITY_DN25211_c0_g1~~TRINITY_DN25211_c0_g1_i1.p1  ORF type:complete len:191 (-),score=11.20 TRINITY_DN25211_c0_g1_i1:402-974(-)
MSGRGGFRGAGGRGGGGRFSGGGGGRSFGRGPPGRGRFGGGGRFGADPQEPPEEVLPNCRVMHPCQDAFIVAALKADTFPQFNAPLYTEQKARVGTVDEIFGRAPEKMMYSVTPAEGVTPASFTPGTTLYINPMKTLPMYRLLNPSTPGRGGGRGRGGARGGGRFAPRGGGGARGGGGRFSGRGGGRGRW